MSRSLCRFRGWPITDCANLAWVHFNTVTANVMAEEFHFSFVEGTFRKFSVEFVVLQDLEDCGQVGQVLGRSPSVNQYVVQVHHDKLVQIWREYLVHDCLECGWRVS